MRLSFWPSVGAIGVTSALKPSVQDSWQRQQIGQATPDNREIQAMRAYGIWQLLMSPRKTGATALHPRFRTLLAAAGFGFALVVSCGEATAQLVDQVQAPNPAGEGIALSLEEQIGLGRGDEFTPDSSIYLIKRDPARAIRRGRQLFQRKFTHTQGLGPRAGDEVRANAERLNRLIRRVTGKDRSHSGRDLARRLVRALGPEQFAAEGIGDIAENIAIGAGLTDSCAACHGRPRGSAGFGGDVVTRPHDEEPRTR